MTIRLHDRKSEQWEKMAGETANKRIRKIPMDWMDCRYTRSNSKRSNIWYVVFNLFILFIEKNVQTNHEYLFLKVSPDSTSV